MKRPRVHPIVLACLVCLVQCASREQPELREGEVANAADGGSSAPVVKDGGRNGAYDPTPDAGSGCLPHVLCSKTPLYQSKIGIWYTLWWMEGGASGHWADWSRYEPSAGYYQSGYGQAFLTQLSQFAAMKLDFLLLDHTNGIGSDGGNIAANGEAVVSALDAANGGLKQAVAIGGALWLGSSPDLALQQNEANYVWDHHANPAHVSRFVANDLPLMVVYTSPGKGDDWQDPRFYVGMATGAVSGASEVMRSRGLYGWVFDEPTPIDKRVMGVMPGWNTAHLGRGTTPISREGGALFIRQWLRAIRENPEIIIINSWNDFAEETSIEPATAKQAGAEAWADSYGTECPTFYAELARGYSLLRWGLELGAYVREESDPTVFLVKDTGLVPQQQMPACHPVLFVPDGYLGQFAKP